MAIVSGGRNLTGRRIFDFVYSWANYASHVVTAIWADDVSRNRRTTIRANRERFWSQAIV